MCIHMYNNAGGSNYNLSLSFWIQADVSNSGKVTASDAATFLKRSNLKEGILHQVHNCIMTVWFCNNCQACRRGGGGL